MAQKNAPWKNAFNLYARVLCWKNVVYLCLCRLNSTTCWKSQRVVEANLVEFKVDHKGKRLLLRVNAIAFVGSIFAVPWRSYVTHCI